MSCSFWIRRKQAAAKKAKEQLAQQVQPEAEKKPVKKAGAKKNDSKAD